MMNHAKESLSVKGHTVPKVTIGLPVYNGERYLRETLDSLVSQDCPGLEIIVSDNGSTDGTAAILADYAARYPALRIITQTRTIDATDNFTFVLEQAAGEYFCWAADDDLRAPGSIRKLVAVLDANPGVVCAMTDVINIWQESDNRSVSRLEEIRLETVLADWPKVRRRFFRVPTSNIFFCVYGLYRTEIIRQVRMKLNLGFSANTEIPMLAQVALLGGIASIAEEGFVYRRHADSIYHKEVANEDPDEPLRRRNVLRRVVGGLILRSNLPFGEKSAIFRELWRDWRSDVPPSRTARIREKQRQRRMKSQKHQKGGKRGMLRRIKARIRRLLGPVPADATIGTPSAPPAPPAPPPPDEILVKRVVNLENPNLRTLAMREEARRRLEKRGWRFERDKRIEIFENHGIRSVIDCGANCGQYVEHLRRLGWCGQVVSFEPLSNEYATLEGKAKGVEGWRTFRHALGAVRGEAEIHVAGNSVSSSLRGFSESFTTIVPGAAPVRSERIQVRRLDETIGEEGLVFDGPILLKLDVQGFEIEVLEGAGGFLDQVRLVQTEMALVPSYEEAPDFNEVKSFLHERGFVLIHLIDGHSNPLTGELREVDGIFANTALIPAALD